MCLLLPLAYTCTYHPLTTHFWLYDVICPYHLHICISKIRAVLLHETHLITLYTIIYIIIILTIAISVPILVLSRITNQSIVHI